MQTLLENEYVAFFYDEERDLLRLNRHSKSFDDPSQVPPLFEELFAAVKPYKGKSLLIDLRQARGNNNPRHEQTIGPLFIRLGSSFPVLAVLVQTAAGKLQMQRLARELGQPAYNVFSDESEAIAFLESRRRK